MRIQKVVALLVVASALAVAGPASGQNFSTDARKIAMGGNGGDSSNIAAGMVEKGAPYTAIVIPLGLIQILNNGLDIFDPNDPNFDPIRAVEDISNPLHYTFGRGDTDSGQQFVHDIRNHTLGTGANHNLLVYKGFKVPTSVSAEGLASPSLGFTLKLFKAGTSFQGVYVGIGPYLGFHTDTTIDPKLSALLGEGTTTPNCAPCSIRDTSRVQLAADATIGYRAKVGLSSAKRDGVYLAYNYHIIKGFQYFNYTDTYAGYTGAPGVSLRIDTNTAGDYVTPPLTNPFTSPVLINGLEATDGKGHASDIGVEVVRGFFEVGFGVNGIGNEITWTDFSQRTLKLDALITTTGTVNPGFVSTKTPVANRSETVELPVVKTANVGFHTGDWGATAVIADGYNGKSFNGGLEKRLMGPLWVRGGGRKSRGKWDPTYGFGLGNKIGLDVGFYGTHANFENKRQTAMAVSLRINH